MTFPTICSDTELIDLVDRIGFLPLLDSGIKGFSAEEMADEISRYVTFPDGGWDWPLWKWKGTVVRESGCYYGKFFNRKAGFISKDWWPDFANWRRSAYPSPEQGSIEEMIMSMLRSEGSLITRELRALCGFTGKNMRSKFDSYLTRLEMGCQIVTEDFVYPHDKNGHEYGWGWSLLTTPEELYGSDCSYCDRNPDESLQMILNHMRSVLPEASDKDIRKMIM